MKNSLIRRMHVILIITVMIVSSSVYGVVIVMSHNTIINDIRQRASGVLEYILDSMTVSDLERITWGGAAAYDARIDDGLRSVFTRADAIMYETKKRQKKEKSMPESPR